MKLVRRIHLWLGVLFAPSIFFFAFTGAMQIYSLHEDGPAWIARLALVHKDQLASVPKRPPRPPQAEPKPEAEKPAAEADKPARPAFERPKPSQPLKAFFLLVALGLMVSTALGVYIAFSFRKDRVTIIGLLAAGLLVPIVFLFL